jgi:hypothetical protein
LILPRIGQIIWIAIIAAVYVRLTLVIAKREELLEKLQPSVEKQRTFSNVRYARASYQYIVFEGELDIGRGSEK